MNDRLRTQLRQFRDETDTLIFGLSVAVTSLLIGVFWLFPDGATAGLNYANEYVIQNLGWVYMVVVFSAVVFVLFLLFSPWGRIKLGTEETEPEFSFVQLFAMMFSAGMAVGLVFWGPTEALVHYDTGPSLFSTEPGTSEMMPQAVQYTFFHQGISPWATYLVFGIAIGYFSHRLGYPTRPATMLAPLFGTDALDSLWAKLVDVAVVVISVGGITVSLGFGVVQFLAGADYAFGVGTGNLETVLFTLGLTVVITLIAALPISAGIQRVSDFNVVLFCLLLAAALVVAPLSFVFGLGSEAFAGYISDFFAMSFHTNFADDSAWVGGWTMFFWAWWLAFAPMIGIFIARISKGRTIREVILVGTVGPISAAFPWFATLGGSALWIESTGQAELTAIYNEHGVEAVGFALFEQLVPFSELFSLLFLLLVLTFLVTTVDSSIVSVAIQTVEGDHDQHPGTLNRIIWGVLVGGLTSLLIVLNGLDALESFVVIVGFPIAIMTVATMAGLALALERRYSLLSTPGETDTPVVETTSDSTETRSGAASSAED